MFESRSAAYEKTGDIAGALKDARKVIDLAPASPQVSATTRFRPTVVLSRSMMHLLLGVHEIR